MDAKTLGYILVGLVIGAAIGVGAFYALYQPSQAGVQQQYTPPETIKAAFVYVGPIGDVGWTHAHEIARQVVQNLYGEWLVTDYRESVTKEGVGSVIDEFVKQGFNVIFTTSFDFMDPTYEKAKQYPNVMFFHCSGYKRAPNMGTYFADLYQVYYLNGLIAGALTKTGKLGYIAAHTIPEVVRHHQRICHRRDGDGQATGQGHNGLRDKDRRLGRPRKSYRSG